MVKLKYISLVTKEIIQHYLSINGQEYQAIRKTVRKI